MERLIDEYRRRWLEAFDKEFGVDSQRWVSVEERLPSDDSYKTDGSLLLWQDHGDGHGSHVVGYFISGRFWLYEGDNIPASEAGVTITHWRQLPDAPEGAVGCR